MTRSFKLVWKPKFISKLVPEDRCHLNGLAMEDGRPRYMTACGTKDARQGWRENQKSGGVLVDIESDDIIAAGLSMPHSPRVHGAFIYLVESGRGALVRIDRQSGAREDICFLPGFGRGLVFCGDYAIVTISLPRWPNFNGLAVAEAMKQRGQDPWRGLQIIDLRTGALAEWFRFDGGVTELFDVALIENIRCPRGLGPGAEEMAHVIRGE